MGVGGGGAADDVDEVAGGVMVVVVVLVTVLGGLGVMVLVTYNHKIMSGVDGV